MTAALDGGAFILIPLIPAALCAFIVIGGLVVGTRDAALWSVRNLRAALARPTLTLHGRAVEKRRVHDGAVVRTVVAKHASNDHYIHVRFPAHTRHPRLGPGPVELDLFAGTKVAGPGRLRQRSRLTILVPEVVLGSRVAPEAPAITDDTEGADDAVWSGDDGWEADISPPRHDRPDDTDLDMDAD
ncbi:hypothetical protein [Myceligenerans pegani]|uniref:Uncharacterized protein n=1 Tax=Myceligenerans pegani TaxID=2776917 RepID=A0ABR9MZ23_9MICO|nr:hypothetical protein [Myceligenerans sp. TRM 65318]MBE1876644.1 hypothetical protein [Myceligenerans sp. TRM 65318]MBE3018915.1 hypothetical protein [Myceligenerans sp. TRM 65318]